MSNCSLSTQHSSFCSWKQKHFKFIHENIHRRKILNVVFGIGKSIPSGSLNHQCWVQSRKGGNSRAIVTHLWAPTESQYQQRDGQPTGRSREHPFFSFSPPPLLSISLFSIVKSVCCHFALHLLLKTCTEFELTKLMKTAATTWCYGLAESTELHLKFLFNHQQEINPHSKNQAWFLESCGS